jgi:hypothetical protein
MAEELAPIVDIRMVERVRQSTSKDGFNDLVVVSQRLQVRRQGSDEFEELDIVIENVDDYKAAPLAGYSNGNR